MIEWFALPAAPNPDTHVHVNHDHGHGHPADAHPGHPVTPHSIPLPPPPPPRPSSSFPVPNHPHHNAVGGIRRPHRIHPALRTPRPVSEIFSGGRTRGQPASAKVIRPPNSIRPLSSRPSPSVLARRKSYKLVKYGSRVDRTDPYASTARVVDFGSGLMTIATHIHHVDTAEEERKRRVNQKHYEQRPRVIQQQVIEPHDQVGDLYVVFVD